MISEPDLLFSPKAEMLQIHNGKCFGFTVFHDSAIPPDEFVSNVQLNIDDLSTNKLNDIWVGSLLRKHVVERLHQYHFIGFFENFLFIASFFSIDNG